MSTFKNNLCCVAKPLLFVTFAINTTNKALSQAVLSDDVEKVRQINFALGRGADVLKSWALGHSGSVVDYSRDDVTVQVPAEALSEISKICEQYVDVAECDIYVGVGKKLIESGKAAIIAREKAPGTVLFYDKDIEEAYREKREAEKSSSSSDLLKAEGVQAPEAAQPSADPDPQDTLPQDATQPPNVQFQPEEPKNAANSYESKFRKLADAQEGRDRVANAKKSGDLDKVKQKTAEALSQLKTQLPVLQQMKDAYPETYQSVLSLVQNVIDLARTVQDSDNQLSKAELQPKIWNSSGWGDDKISIPGNGHPSRSDFDSHYKSQVEDQYGEPEEYEIQLNKIQATGFVPNSDRLHLYKTMYECGDHPHKVVLEKCGKDGYKVLDGEHRLAGAKEAGLARIGAYVINPIKKDMLATAYNGIEQGGNPATGEPELAPQTTGIKKMQTPPAFPKLGVHGVHSPTPIVNTPQELKSKVSGVYSQLGLENKNPEVQAALPIHRENEISNPSMGARLTPTADMYSPTAGEIPQKGYALSNALRTKLKPFAIHPVEPTSDLATQQHENFHDVMNQVEVKHGRGIRRNLARNILNELKNDPGHGQAVKWFAQNHIGRFIHKPDKPMFDEEVLAHMHNYLNDKGYREGMVNGHALTGSEIPMDLGNRLKSAFKHFRNIAANADNRYAWSDPYYPSSMAKSDLNQEEVEPNESFPAQNVLHKDELSPKNLAHTDARNVLHVKSGNQLGSNEGGFYHGKDGVKRYVKFYKDPAQAHGEHLSNVLYRKLGVEAPESGVFEDHGNHVHAAKVLHGQPMHEAGITPERAREFFKGFAGDVLLSNWDAAGLHGDNAFVTHDGKVARIDNGGALLARAMGGRKTHQQLGSLSELESFFPGGKISNPGYHKIADAAGYKNIHDFKGDFLNQIEHINQVHKEMGGWKSFVEAHAPKLNGADQAQMAAALEHRTKMLNDKANELKGNSFAKEEMPDHMKAHRSMPLPVGTVHNGEMKIQHGLDGKKSWLSMRSGMIQGNNPDDLPLFGANSHPVSSLRPNSK